MKTEEIVPIAMPVRNSGQRADRKSAAPNKAKMATAPKINADVATSLPPDRIQLINLENANSQSQQMARQIRNVDQAMQAIDSHLSEMRKKLEQIVKIYPPYPPESAERAESLRQFSALRKMIEQLTPSDPQHDLPHDMDQLPLHSAQDGLDLPDIAIQASDQEIADALDKTSEAHTLFKARRQSFVTDANRILSRL